MAGWIESSLDKAAADGQDVFVAVAGDAVVGLVTVTERRHFAGEIDAYVGELVVRADHEHRGVGTLLMAEAEEWARQRGLRHLTLDTGAANHGARAFYARRGYQEEDVRLTKRIEC
ncbi:GNAT family N-acetyltransferase [Paractinoplanes bogorensis]|uniref:GNAT family N-acetyltransferase n=1 Tax=Paractinoplanes bogorensis TaxID=1610840 RepID=UPI0027E00430|nr:GNAT family N-acetyltransferase [Actinoplanes bogorensis]